MLAELSGSTEKAQDLAAERSSNPTDDLTRKKEVDFTVRSLSTLWARQRQVQLALERLAS